jgi:hypothetical protein
MNWSQLLADAMPHLVELVLLVLGALVVAARTGLAKLITEKADNELLKKALLFVDNMVFELVSEAYETAAREIEQHFADGKLTKEERGRMLAEVKKDVLAKLKEIVFGKFGDLFGGESATEKVLSAKVESALPAVKAESKAKRDPLAKLPAA